MAKPMKHHSFPYTSGVAAPSDSVVCMAGGKSSYPMSSSTLLRTQSSTRTPEVLDLIRLGQTTDIPLDLELFRSDLKSYEDRMQYDRWINGGEVALHKSAAKWAQKKGISDEQAVLRFILGRTGSKAAKKESKKSAQGFDKCSCPGVDSDIHYYYDGTIVHSHNVREWPDEDIDGIYDGSKPQNPDRLNGYRITDYLQPWAGPQHPRETMASHAFCRMWRAYHAGFIPMEFCEEFYGEQKWARLDNGGHTYATQQPITRAKKGPTQLVQDLEYETFSSNLFNFSTKFREENLDKIPPESKKRFIEKCDYIDLDMDYEDDEGVPSGCSVMKTSEEVGMIIEEVEEDVTPRCMIEEVIEEQVAIADHICKPLLHPLPLPAEEEYIKMKTLVMHATSQDYAMEKPQEIVEFPRIKKEKVVPFIEAAFDEYCKETDLNQLVSKMEDLKIEDEVEEEEMDENLDFHAPPRKIPRRQLDRLKLWIPSEFSCNCDQCIAAFVRRNKNIHSEYSNDHPKFKISLNERRRQRVLKRLISSVALRKKERAHIQAGDDEALETETSVAGTSNITFVEERATDYDSTHTSGEMSAKDPNKDMAENMWNMKEVLGREIVVYRGIWNSTSQQVNLVIPRALTDKQDSMTTQQLKLFAFFRAGVSIRIQLNGYKFCCGRLIAFLVPPLWADDALFYSPKVFPNFPHVFLDASVSNIATLEVPFSHFLSYFVQRSGLIIDNFNTLGKLVIYPFNVLRSAEGGAGELSYTVYMKFTNPEPHQAIYPIDNFSYHNATGLIALVPPTEKAHTQGLEGLLKGLATKGVSTGLNFADKMTGGLVTGIGDTVTKLFGFNCDKPLDPLPPAPIANRTLSNLCHGAGVDQSLRLSLTPISQTDTTQAQIGSISPDFDLKTLCQIPTLLYTDTISTSTQPGLLTYFPVTPMVFYDKVESQSRTEYTPTMLSYISRAFLYWRGSIKIKIQFITTQMHSARVAVCFHPAMVGGTWSEFGDLDKIQNLNTVVIDVEEQKEIEIDIPFMSIKPWLRSGRFYHYKTDNDKTLGHNFTGYVGVYLWNKLVAPSNVPQEIDYNVFIYAGNDFELAYPCPLDPVAVSTISDNDYGSDGMYPYVFNKISWVFFDNRDWIDYVYQTGKRLATAGKFKGTATKWYDNDIDDSICGEEAVQWYFEVAQLKRYLDDEGITTTPQLYYIKSLPNYKYPTAHTQALEEDTTTRDNNLTSITTTKEAQSREIAPTTISENAMNLGTVLKRFYPVVSTFPITSLTGYTLVTLPVSPSYIPTIQHPVINNKSGGAYAQPHPTTQVTWFSRLFTYWRGSMRYKILFNVPCEAIIVHTPENVVDFSIRRGVSVLEVQRRMSYASTIAHSNTQNVFEVEVPYASTYNQLLIDAHNKNINLLSTNGTLLIYFRIPAPDTEISCTIFHSIAEDTVFNIIKAPPKVFTPQLEISDCTEGTIFQNDTETDRMYEDDAVELGLIGDSPMALFEGKGGLGKCAPLPSEPRPHTQALVDWVVSTKMQDSLTNCLDAGTRLAERLDTVVTRVENVMPLEDGHTAIEFYTNLSVNILMLHTLIDTFHELMNKHNVANVVKFGTVFAGLLGFNFSKSLKLIVYQMAEWAFNVRQLPRAQAHNGDILDTIEGYEDKIIPILAVLGTIIYAYIFDALPSFNDFKRLIKGFFESTDTKPHTQAKGLSDFLKNAHFSVLGFKAVDTVYQKMCEYVSQFIDWLLSRENPAAVLERKAGAYKDRVLSLIQRLDEADNEAEVEGALMDPDIHNKYYLLMDDATQLLKESLDEKLDTRVSILIKEAHTKARKLISNLEQIKPTHTARYDPFVICIHGPTGTGKTALMQHVTNACLNAINAPKYNRIYNKSDTKDGFWSNYRNQQAVHWDEFGQNREAKESVPEFVTLRGNDPKILNMAALEDKGRYFTSKLIVMTTNVPYERFDQNIRDPDAFFRRRHYMIGTDHRPGHDANQMQQQQGFDQDFSHVAFARTSNMSNQILRHGLDLAGIMESVTGEFVRWNQKQMEILDQARGCDSDQILPRGIVVRAAADGETDEQPEEIEEVAHTEGKDDEEENYDSDIFYDVPLQGDIESVAEQLPDECHCHPLVFLKGMVKDLTLEEELQRDLFLDRVKDYKCCIRSKFARVKAETTIRASYLYKKAKQVFASILEKAKNFIKDNPRVATLIGVTMALGTAGLVFLGTRSAGTEGTYEAGISKNARSVVRSEGTYEAGINKTSRSVVRSEGVYDTNGGKLPRQVVRAEGSEDPNAFDLKPTIHNNMVIIKWTQAARNATLRALHIGGSVLLLPFHFFNGIENGDKFTITNRQIEFDFHQDNIYRLKDYDWCLYDCGVRLQPRKNLIKYFIKECNLGLVKTTSALQLLLDKDGERVYSNCTAKGVRTFEYEDTKLGRVYRQQCWETNVSTRDGDCGSPLLALHPQLPPPGKILGIHVAGFYTKSQGYSVLITQEQLQEAWDLTRPQVQGMLIPPELSLDEPLSKCKILPEGDYSIYGVMPAKLSPAQPQKTTLVETPFYPLAAVKGPAPKIPARLTPFVNEEGERVSPLRKALTKYGKVTKSFPRKQIQKVKEYLKHYFKEQIQPVMGRKVVSEQEAIMGVPGIKSMERINMNSSPGWPYQVLNKSQPGKHYLFGDDCSIISPELRQRLDHRETEAKNLRRVASVWRDCLKDELRPVEKVKAGKTRLFTIAPVDFTILVRKYFLDFTASFYERHNKFFSAVGINPESLDWTVLYNYLAEYGKNCVAGDFGTFDGTLMAELMEVAVDLINEWYDDTPENRNVRKTLFNEMIHTMQLVENTLYATHQGNPSGNPLTVVINTIVNLLYMILVFLEIYPGATVQDFFDNVRVVCYGDDNNLVVKPGWELFNQNSITEHLAVYNIEYTTELKDHKEVSDYRNLDTITFLKRGFRRDPEFGRLFVLPTMAKETIESFFYYMHSTEDKEEQLLQNMRAGLNFAAFHGREYYNSYLNRWKFLMHSENFSTIHISFNEQTDIFRFNCSAGSTTEASMDSFMKISNSKACKTVLGMTQAIPYYLCAAIGIMSSDVNIDRSDDRWAVAIPSGEGKSTLCRMFPRVFVDHDDLLLPTFNIKELVLKGKYPWSHDQARKYDYPPDDRRILLVHHPENTKRQMIGSFVTHFPKFVRINTIQRLKLKNPYKVDRDTRNSILINLARTLEPQLFTGSELNHLEPSLSCLNQPVSESDRVIFSELIQDVLNKRLESVENRQLLADLSVRDSQPLD